jgi:hypothetical protein
MSEIELARRAARGLPAIPEHRSDSAQADVARDVAPENAGAHAERMWGIG